MGILKGLFSSDLIKSVGDALDKNITSAEERAEATKAITSVLLDFQSKVNTEVTERLRIDMSSDNKLSKVIRPLSMIFTTAVFAILSVTDGNIHLADSTFTIGEDYIAIYKALLLLQYAFYFGSKTIERVTDKITTKK